MITRLLLVNATRIMGKHPRMTSTGSAVRSLKSWQQSGIYRLNGSFWAFVPETWVTFVCTVRLPEGFRYNHGSRKMQRVGMVSLAGVFRL